MKIKKIVQASSWFSVILLACILMLSTGCGKEALKNIIVNQSVKTAKEIKEYKPPKQYPNPVGHFVNGPQMHEARYDHTATLLDNGDVLITGGMRVGGLRQLKSAEIYLAKESKFIQISELNIPRRSHVAIKIDNGKVLFFGGDAEFSIKPWKTGATDIIEEYDPATRQFKIIGKMLDPRRNCKAVTLDNGRIFIYGGAGPKSKGQWHCELYDPKTNTSTYTSKMHYLGIQRGQVLAKLKDGRVFIKVGESFTPEEVKERREKRIYNTEPKPDRLGAIELYDPKTDKYELKYVLREYRSEGCLVALPDNRIVLVGGYYPSINKIKWSQKIEIYNINTGKSEIVGQFSYPITAKDLFLVKNKYIVNIGKESEAFDISENKLINIGSRYSSGNFTATQLNDSQYLIAGGQKRSVKAKYKSKVTDIFNLKNNEEIKQESK